MKIIDCITFFDEELILKLRLNILYDYVDKFIITEGAFDHRGNKRKLNFDIKKFEEFSDKIIYVPIYNFPNLNDPWKMLEYQRNASLKYIKKFDPEDYVLVSDADEIPNPTKIIEFVKSKKDIGVFKQLLFYYKLNLLNVTTPDWLGTKICKIKKLRNPNWLRAYKSKQYAWWRVDKPKNVNIISDGGWHFSFVYNVDGIIKKISSYQHTEYDKDDIKDRSTIKKKINDGEDIFNRGYTFKKIEINKIFPQYIVDNKANLQDWIKN